MMWRSALQRRNASGLLVSFEPVLDARHAANCPDMFEELINFAR